MWSRPISSLAPSSSCRSSRRKWLRCVHAFILCVNHKLRCVQLLVSAYMCHVANDTGNTAIRVPQVLANYTGNTTHKPNIYNTHATHIGAHEIAFHVLRTRVAHSYTQHTGAHIWHTHKTLTYSTSIQGKKNNNEQLISTGLCRSVWPCVTMYDNNNNNKVIMMMIIILITINHW